MLIGGRRQGARGTRGAGLRSVEHACAVVLSRVEAKLYSLRYVVEKLRPRVPRGLLNALCLGVLRNYRLLVRGLRYCGHRGQVRGRPEGWLPLVGAYEAMFRRDAVPLDRVVEATRLPRDVAECLRRAEPEDIVSGLEGLERLAVLYSLPLWVVEKLAELNPPGGLEALLKSLQEPTPIWIRFNKRRLTLSQAIELLSRAGVRAEPDPVLDDIVEAIEVEPGAPERLDPRLFYIQDRAAALAAHVLGDPGGLLLDSFSAPGNKLAHAMWRSGPRAAVAVEISPRRLLDEKRLLRRQGATLADLVAGDATQPPLRPGSATSALVDPDCTSMGRLGHSPETRLFLERAGPGIVEKLQRLQKAGLRAALTRVKPGARVVYMTCTLTRDENEDVVMTVAEEGLAELEEAEPLIGVWSPWLPRAQRIYPHVSRSTGGFIAVLRRS